MQIMTNTTKIEATSMVIKLQRSVKYVKKCNSHHMHIEQDIVDSSNSFMNSESGYIGGGGGGGGGGSWVANIFSRFCGSCYVLF